MIKAILTSTLEEAQNVLHAIDLSLGLPNYETGTLSYCTIGETLDRTQYYVMVPEDNEIYRQLGMIIDFDIDTEAYRGETPPGMHLGQ